jgi:hypothetical protein
MSKFLRLTTFLLNTNDIHKIVIHSNKYMIHVISKKMDGFGFGFYGFGTGHLSSSTYEIEVCGKKHVNDYRKMTEWINRSDSSKGRIGKRCKRLASLNSLVKSV